jgi:hypothetical protein
MNTRGPPSCQKVLDHVRAMDACSIPA